MAKKDKKEKKAKKAKKAAKVAKVAVVEEAKVAAIEENQLAALQDKLAAEAILAHYEAKQPKNRTYTVRCTEEDLVKWKAAADQKEASVSMLVTSLLDIYCDKLA